MPRARARARSSQRPGRQESRTAGPLLTAAPLISTDHPLVSITVTRATAARPPPSLDQPFYPLLCCCCALPPAPRSRRGTPLRAVRKTAPEMHRTRRRIHSVLLLLRMPSRVRVVPRSEIFQGSRSAKSPGDLWPCKLCPSHRRASISLPRDFFARATRYVAISRSRESLELRDSDRGKRKPRGTAGVVYRLTREFKVPGNESARVSKKHAVTLGKSGPRRTRLVLSRSRERVHLLRAGAHYARRIRNSVHEVDNRGPPRDRGLAHHTVATASHQGCHARAIGHDAPRAVSPTFPHPISSSFVQFLVTLRAFLSSPLRSFYA